MTHTLMTMLTAIIASIYVCVNIVKLKDKEILKQLGISVLCILGISAFFWIPMVETYFSADYAVYQEDSMATTKSLYESGLDIKTLLYTDTKGDTTYVFEVGIPILIMLCLSILAIKKGIDKKYRKEYILFLILGILSTVVTIKEFPWGIFEDIFQIIQFKWRMLLFSNFFLAIICAINMNMLIKKFNYKDIIVISTIFILYLVLFKPLLPEEQDIRDINRCTIGEVTENKTEAIIGMGKGEYLPVKSNDNREYIRTREDTVYMIKGSGEIKEVNRKGQSLTCKISALENGTIVEFPYIYYPGYKIIVNGEKVESFESENGFLAVSLPEMSSSEVVVEYVGTNLMTISKIISGMTLISMIVFKIAKKYKRSKFKS